MRAIDLFAGAGGFTIKLVSVDGGGSPAPITGTVGGQQYTFTIATSTTLSNFDADKFTIDATDFAANNAGTWSIQPSGNDVQLVFAAVPEPAMAGLLALPLLMLHRRRR